MTSNNVTNKKLSKTYDSLTDLAASLGDDDNKAAIYGHVRFCQLVLYGYLIAQEEPA